ncbi:hypothetical protein [Palaeococcus ferrophilus]|uniref:hypothetical protein n=1 Tax=Palaeococcus ferrophilus TaxID=83868 RepID=UPI00064E451C|nr:hypothetical protein [Palaeococcus ferrophilus]
MNTDSVFLFLSILLLVLLYYGFMKVSFEVFTYKKPSRALLFLVSVAAVLPSLRVSYVLGFLILLAFLAYERLSLREAVVVALTTQFGFMIGMAVTMVFLTGVGFVLNIPSFKVNMSPEDIIRFLKKP